MRTSKEIMNIIDERRKELGMSQAELSRRTDVSKAAISRYLNGSRDFPINLANKFANVLNISTEYLLDIYKPKDVVPAVEDNVINIPLVGEIACGQPILSQENIEGYMPTLNKGIPKGQNFFLTCKGNSMYPTIPDGAYVLIHTQPDVENDEIAAVMINGEGTLKRVKKLDNQVLLVPDNNEFDPIVLKPDNENRIIGKAIKVEKYL